LVRGKVKETRGIELVPEVKLMGKSWEEALESNQ
jgi:UDP-N-acetylenolpyruvoylglucosamine reductase